jgi:hypothetical protein
MKMHVSYSSEVETRIKHDAELRHAFKKNADFVRYALTHSGAGQYVKNVIFTDNAHKKNLKEYTIGAFETFPPQIMISINPFWFNNLKPVDKWKYVTEIILKLDKDNEQTRAALSRLSK